MELLSGLGMLFINVVLLIAVVSGLLAFTGVILEFLFIAFELVCAMISGLFYFLPKWCWKKARGM